VGKEERVEGKRGIREWGRKTGDGEEGGGGGGGC